MFQEDVTADNGAGGTSITIPVPTNGEDGDLLYMALAIHGTTTGVATPSGWTVLRSASRGTAPDTIRMADFYRFADTEPADYTVTLNESASAVGAICRYSEVISLGTNGATASATSANPQASTITVATAYALIVHVFAHKTVDTYLPPPQTDQRVVQSAASGTATLGIHDYAWPDPIATGSRAADGNNSADWVAHQIGFPQAREIMPPEHPIYKASRRTYAQ